MGFDYVAKAFLLPSCCGFFVSEFEVSFLVSSSLFVNGCSAISCDFDVFMRGGELKSFYSTILSGIKGLLLVWMLASNFSVCAGCYPLDMGYAGAVALACPQDGGASTWHLLTGLVAAAVACAFPGQWGQSLVSAHGSPRGSCSLSSPGTVGAGLAACSQIS